MLGKIIILGIVLLLVVLFFVFVPVGLWISAIASGVKISIINLIGMKLRRVAPKKIVVDMTEDKEHYIFSISNNGPMIPKDMQPHIFRKGVTTKLEREHGMGLYIVMNVVKEYEGNIEMTSTEDETKFVVTFPKRKKVNMNG